MSKMIEINLRPEERILRQFGFIALGGFLLLAVLAWTESLLFSFGLGGARLSVTIGLAGIGILAALVSLVYPKANRPLYVGLVLVAYPIGFVLSYVIMAALFYLMITPVGLLFRLIGRDPMHRRFEPEAETYWVDARAGRSRESYFRQF
jgi:MFS family permease